MTDIEVRRQKLQFELDKGKDLKERNIFGQYSTPYKLAYQICQHIKSYVEDEIDSFLEPAIGTGVFYSALSELIRIKRSVGYEIDQYYFNPTASLWSKHNIELYNQDFLKTNPYNKFSLIIANPPYSRHHHISPSLKVELSTRIKKLYGINVSGLSGLYLYFIILSTQWLKEGGLSCWLIPSEFLSVKYGIALKQFLINNVDLISIHTYDNNDVQFTDALVSSSVIVFRNCKPSSNPVKYSWGNDINSPNKLFNIEKKQLDPFLKWNESITSKIVDNNNTRFTIGSFFHVKRGISTGDNKFFIIDNRIIKEYHIPSDVLSSVIPPPRKLKSDIYNNSSSSQDNLFLITCNDSEEIVKIKYPGLYKYLTVGIENGVNLRANCKNRMPWYRCEKRDVAPILVSYMGRENGQVPLRFILNNARALATNSYLMMYPKKEYQHLFNDEKSLRLIWDILRAIPKDILISHGRSYGGGLIKWEPKELESVPCSALEQIIDLTPSLFNTKLT